MKSKLRNVYMLIPAQNAILNSPISPTLGQFGIKVKLFCDNFNQKTINKKKNLLLKTKIIIYKDLSFDIKIKETPISFFIELFSVKDNSIKYITKINVYKIILIYSFFEKKKNFELLQNFSHIII